MLATVAVPDGPADVLAAGPYVWVASNGADRVTKLRASDGMVVGSFRAGRHPSGLAFDGSSIWVSNSSGQTVARRSSDVDPSAARLGQ